MNFVEEDGPLPLTQQPFIYVYSVPVHATKIFNSNKLLLDV
jgi:hypothetical protein